MGKVLSSFTNGYAGAIARSIDDIVISMANKSGEDLAFGVAVALDEDRTGIVPFDPAEHTSADFLGFTVRNPSKTPDSYGSDTGSYANDDLADVLVRGHIVIGTSGSLALGDQIGVNTSGKYVAYDSTVTGEVALPNVRVSAAPDSGSMTEVVLTGRNLL